MKTHELFEQQWPGSTTAPDFYDATFDLILTDDFGKQDAERIAQMVADQVGGKLDVGDHLIDVIGGYVEPDELEADDVIENQFMRYMVYEIPSENVEMVEKILRRLSRGKPRFQLPAVELTPADD